MTIPNERNQSEFEDSINVRPITKSEKSYRDGYYQGRATENNLQTENIIAKEEGTSIGLFIGLILAILTVLGITGLFFLNEEPTTVLDDSTSNETVEPEKQTTIIERTIEKTQEVVPVPQVQPTNPEPVTSESQPIENSINIPITTETENPGDVVDDASKTTEINPDDVVDDISKTTETKLNQDNSQVDFGQPQSESTP